MGCCSGLFRLLMFIFNFACLIVGIVLIAVGTLFYINVDQYDNLLDEASGLNIVPSVTIALGVIVFIISFLGCCGAMKHSSCMLYSYAGLLIILLVIQFSIGIYGLVKADKNDISLQQQVIKEMNKAFVKYNEPNHVTKDIFDSIQLSLKCCGVDTPFDYTTKLLMAPPPSCCGKTGTDETCNIKEIYGEGCGKTLFDAINDAIKIVAIVVLVICAVEMLGAIFAICLARNKN